MLRIISGKYKGQKLHQVKSKNVRPTQAKVKKSMLQILEPFSNKTVLDLFSGSGALGIEALSRGAKSIVSVDNNRTNHRYLHNNFNNICEEDTYSIKCIDAVRYLKSTKDKFDIILCDPPYFKYEYMEIFNLSKLLLNTGGHFCMEMEKNVVDENIFRVKIYGSSQVILWRNNE